MSQEVLLAVNGTLMRGLKLNPNMAAAKATFVREAATEPAYRLWSIRDDHPAMVRVTDGKGVKVAVEIWSVPASGLASVLLKEPPGLTIGRCGSTTERRCLASLASRRSSKGRRR